MSPNECTRLTSTIRIAAICLFALAILSAPLLAQPPGPPFTVRISMGYQDTEPTLWTGNIQPEGAQITDIQPWLFTATGKVTLPGSWSAQTTKRPARPQLGIAEGIVPIGVCISGQASPAARFTVSTNKGDFTFALSDTALGREPIEKLNGAVRIERLPSSSLLTDAWAADDYPSIAVGNDGTAWAAWQSYSGRNDTVRIAKYFEDRWARWTPVPGASGDVWRPQIAVDPSGRVWVVWSQQVEGNWDLYARAFVPTEKGGRWEQKVRLTHDPGTDMNHSLFKDSEGRFWLAWQAYREPSSDILLTTFDGEAWSGDIMTICDDPANDWFPSVTADNSGTAWVVWDSYREDNYSIFMRSYREGQLGDEIPVADTPKREANASVACDGEGRVWVAWDESGANWGKDQGATIRQTQPGLRLWASRDIGIAIFAGGERKVPAASPQDFMPERQRRFCQYPELLTDPEGRVWLLMRHMSGTEPRGARRKVFRFWSAFLTCYEGDSWIPAIEMPNGWGRNGSCTGITSAPDGTIWIAWNTDRRVYYNAHAPVEDDIYAGFVPGRGPVQTAVLQDPPEPELIEVKPGHPNEPADVAAMRAYSTSVGGKRMGVVRGDLHRHQEFSWDSGGAGDGSVMEHFRYMIDAASMDFGAMTDHQAGGGYEYWWWLTEKLADLFHWPGSYVPLYGYERSATWPWGHRNVFHTYRGAGVVDFFTKPDFRGARPGVGSGALVEDDSLKLFEELKRTGGLGIIHTSGTNMGTDWSWYGGQEVDPVVEIFQGARNSYEAVGAPRANENPGQYTPGMVQNAWAKGQHYGTICSSDHGSTHISYAMVYTPEVSREGILNSIRARHTYGATDNIILDYRVGKRFMGEELRASRPPKLSVSIRGTRKIAQVGVCKNNKYVYTTQPNEQDVTFTFMDSDAQPGESFYYVRVIQEDGQIAWSSPIWVEYG